MKKIATALVVLGSFAGAAAVSPGTVSAGGATYTVWGCQVTQNVVRSAANSTTALGSTYVANNTSCTGTRSRLGFSRNGTNYISAVVTDTSATNQYNAIAQATNATPRYVDSSVRSSGGTWSGYQRLNY